MAILVELRVIPIATPTTSLSTYVAEVLKILDQRGLKRILTPFGTCIEVPSFEDLADVLKAISEHLKHLGIGRLVIDLAIDIRFDKPVTLESKVRSVEEKIR